MVACAVVKICCDRAEGVEYFDDYPSAADYRTDWELSTGSGAFVHDRAGILVRIDGEYPPAHAGLEEHQVWVRIGDRWEVRGTGCLE